MKPALRLLLPLTLALWVGVGAAAAQPIVINEVMSSNSATIADEDGDFPDWIEIFNAGSHTVNLLGYGLSDSPATPFEWVFPSVELAPGAHLLVWASDKHRTVPPSAWAAEIPLGSTWRYLDNGANPGALWHMPEFNDSLWAQGPAMLGYGGTTAYGTTLSFGPDAQNKHIAYYFRRQFQVEGVVGHPVRLRLRVDDGAVIYLNGTEVARHNMPTGEILHTTRATTSVTEISEMQWDIPAHHFRSGPNVLAVQVHQVLPTSSDIRFDLELRGQGRTMLHTNFAISADGETVTLTNPQGHTESQIVVPPLAGNISYGRSPDGADHLGLFGEATPGAPNAPQVYQGVAPPPTFSHAPGFYTAGFSLTLQAPAGTQIIYTLDGSEPDPENLGGRTFEYRNSYPSGPNLTATYRTLPYSGPIAIANRTGSLEVISRMSSTFDERPDYFPTSRTFKGTAVRARAVREGYLPSPVVSGTYFVSPQGRARYSLPVISIAMPARSLFDFNTGIYVPGRVWVEQGGGVRDGGAPANYNQRGDEWERPANFEFFEPNAPAPVVNQKVGIRIHGGWSRAHRMKSLRVYARGGLGNDELNHPFFPDQPLESYRRLILRNSGNDFGLTMFRDAAIHRTVAPLGLEVMAYRPSVVFINGEYWGIHNIRERFDRFYVAGRFGVDPDSVDLLTNEFEVQEGYADHYLAMLSYIQTHDVAAPNHFAHVATMMDVENFTDYQITHIFARNTDWPGNNIDFWRHRTPAFRPESPRGHDGRWRWMVFDTDFGFGIWDNTADHNTLAHATQAGGTAWPNPDWSTFLLRSLLTNPTFRERFINRFADLLNTLFLPERVIGIIDAMAPPLEPEMPEHIARWRQPWSMDSWWSEIEKMRTFASQRPDYQRQHIRSHFGLPGTVNLTVGVSNPAHGHVRVNTIHLLPTTPGVSPNPYPWRGVYFQGVPIEFEAIPRPGHVFVRWEGLAATSATASQRFNTHSASVTARFAPAAPIHSWHFNSLPDGSLARVDADASLVPGGQITFVGTGSGFMDRVNEGTTLNATEDTPPGTGLRVRNPSNTRQLVIAAPTTGYKHIRFSYAVRRTSNGAYFHRVEYRASAQEPWQVLNPSVRVEDTYTIMGYSLPSQGVDNNPNLELRLVFEGDFAAGIEGNNRFDNMRVDGVTLDFTGGDDELQTPAPVAFRVWYRQGQVHLYNPYPGPSTLHIYSMSGARMGSYQLSGGGQHSLPFGAVGGVYIARLVGHQQSHAGRFVVNP